MRYYDIVMDTCTVSERLERMLGFARIGVSGRGVDVVAADKSSAGSGVVVVGKDAARLASAAKSAAAAICLEEPAVDKELLRAMADNGCALCIPLSRIMESFGMRRPRLIYKTERLFSAAKREGVPVAFVTLARSNSLMCSYMQLIELAKMVGADEQYARNSISVTNKGLIHD